MKTVDEFIKEIDSSETLKTELKAIKDKEALAVFLKKNDVGVSVNEYIEYVKSMYEGELKDEDAAAVAGGQRALPWIEPTGIL